MPTLKTKKFPSTAFKPAKPKLVGAFYLRCPHCKEEITISYHSACPKCKKALSYEEKLENLNPTFYLMRREEACVKCGRENSIFRLFHKIDVCLDCFKTIKVKRPKSVLNTVK